MLVTISTTRQPATDLGFLLHKHPDKSQSFEMAVGTAHVLWPEAGVERNTVALLLEVDPIAVVRGRGSRGSGGFSLAQYVNDRPYAASSMLAVALGKVFRTAMAGRCDARPELVDQRLPLKISVPALPSSGGAELVQRLLEPLGWQVEVTPIPLAREYALGVESLERAVRGEPLWRVHEPVSPYSRSSPSRSTLDCKTPQAR